MVILTYFEKKLKRVGVVGGVVEMVTHFIEVNYNFRYQKIAGYFS